MIPDSNISWPQLYFTAEATKEKFEDVHIITLKSEYLCKAFELVAVLKHGTPITKNIQAQAINLIKQGCIKGVCEYVEITSTGTTVCLNVDYIIDTTIFTALKMLAAALDQLNGKFGIVTTGPNVTFTPHELGWLVKH